MLKELENVLMGFRSNLLKDRKNILNLLEYDGD